MLLEVVGKKLDLNKLSAEYKWIGLPHLYRTRLNSRRPMLKYFWQIRCLETDFSDWWKKKNKVSIFFDGASKRNPRNVGAGGLIFFP